MYFDDVAIDVQLVNHWIYVAQDPQVGCRGNLDSHRICRSNISRRPRQEEALEERRLHHGKLVEQRN